MYNHSGPLDINQTNIIQKFRTDEVDVSWIKDNKKKLILPDNLIAKGAESNIEKSSYFGIDAISKIRIPKAYRIKEIDDKIIKSRTKSEAKLLSDIKIAGVLSPILYDIDLKNKSILMEKIEGELIKDILDKDNSKELALKIGENIAKIHSINIVHGDITTSNMFLNHKNNLVFIDLGLGKYSDLLEDKVSDLLVIKNSLKAIDYEIATYVFDNILDSYVLNSNFTKNQILNKLSDIESRARYTH